MWRILAEGFLLFIIPFVIAFFVIFLRKRNPLEFKEWNPSFLWLVIAGLILALGGFLYAGVTAERYKGSYIPPHLENGRLVPGQFHK